MKIVREKGFYVNFTKLTLVIAAQLVITFGVNVADNLMLGAYSEDALSGATLATQIFYFLNMLVLGLGNGVVVLGSQYWGKGEPQVIRRIISVGIKFSAGIGLVFLLAGALFANQIMGAITSEPAVQAQAAEYFSTVCYSYFLFGVSYTLITAMRSVEITILGPITSTTTLIINICLNYCLIFGHFGMPALGARGAAIATTISRVVELCIVCVYVFGIDKRIKLQVRDLFRFDTAFIGDYLKVSLPLVGSLGLFGLAHVMFGVVMGHMNGDALAASSIAETMSEFAGVFGTCAASSAAIIIGKTVGSGRLDLLKSYAITLQMLFLGIALLSSLIMFVIKLFILDFYTLTPEARETAETFLTLLCFIVFCTAYQYPVSGGIIQGGGNTKYPFIVDTIVMWLVAIPLACLSLFVWHLGPVATYFFLKIDQPLKCIPHSIYCNRFTWVRELTRPVEGQDE